jgi:hypothetical protein
VNPRKLESVKQEEVVKRAVSVRDRLFRKLREARLPVELPEQQIFWNARITVKGQYGLDIDVKPMRENWGFRERYTGKLCIVFGSWGRRKTYPEPKTGFDLDKIAGLIKVWLDKVESQDSLEKTRAKNYALRERAVSDLEKRMPTVTRHFTIEALPDPEGGYKVTCRFETIELVEEMFQRFAVTM